MEKTNQHMLIDFSDALQVNVYTLGTCFLKFRRLLNLQLKVIGTFIISASIIFMLKTECSHFHCIWFILQSSPDPALYIYRFAAHLDLDDKANDVSLTALRLVARMKRDWIVLGRRPAGICAAALLIGEW